MGGLPVQEWKEGLLYIVGVLSVSPVSHLFKVPSLLTRPASRCHLCLGQVWPFGFSQYILDQNELQYLRLQLWFLPESRRPACSLF